MDEKPEGKKKRGRFLMVDESNIALAGAIVGSTVGAFSTCVTKEAFSREITWRSEARTLEINSLRTELANLRADMRVISKGLAKALPRYDAELEE